MSDDTKMRLPLWLIVSLMANALLIGVLVGGGLGQRKAGPPAMPGSEQALMRGIDRTVPDDQRRAVRQAFRRAFADSRQERIRLRDARRQLADLLAADPYNEAAVQAAFADIRAADDAMKSRLHDVLAEQLGTLSAEQRQVILRESSRRGAARPRPHEGDRPSPPSRPFRDKD